VTNVEIAELVVQEVPERSYVVARERVTADGLSAIPRLIEQTATWVMAHGGACGAPATLCGPPEQDGTMELAVGWPTVSAEEPPPPLERLVRHGCRAVVYRHAGPYSGLPEVYAALVAAIADDGLRPAGSPWEVYETRPEDEPDPAHWLTEIVWPVEA